jgi:hypothetical protein
MVARSVRSLITLSFRDAWPWNGASGHFFKKGRYAQERFLCRIYFMQFAVK